MPDKSLRPEDFRREEFSRRDLRPNNSETKDLSAHRVDFRPTQTTDRPGWKHENERPASAPEWLEVGSVAFQSSSRVPERPPKARVEVKSHSAEVLGQAVKGEYQYGKLGLILGLACIVGGIILGLNGVAGHTSWTAKLLGLESNINDAAPGVVLFVVGIFFVWITKPRVKLGELKG